MRLNQKLFNVIFGGINFTSCLINKIIYFLFNLTLEKFVWIIFLHFPTIVLLKLILTQKSVYNQRNLSKFSDRSFCVNSFDASHESLLPAIVNEIIFLRLIFFVNSKIFVSITCKFYTRRNPERKANANVWTVKCVVYIVIVRFVYCARRRIIWLLGTWQRKFILLASRLKWKDFNEILLVANLWSFFPFEVRDFWNLWRLFMFHR